MSKLFSLKQWLTIPECAKYLSIAFGEEVTEADVLRLGLDDQLQLSVSFVNHAKARCGRITSPDKARTVSFPQDVKAAIKATAPDEYQGGYMDLVIGPTLSDGQVIDLTDEIITLDGVYDLPMIGGERLDIEHKFQMLTDGPAITLSNLDGAFVECADGTICQLQDSYDDNEFSVGSRAHLEKLRRRAEEQAADPVEVRALVDGHLALRTEFLAKQRTRAPKERYHPSGGLPDDAVLVVRTEALRSFERALAANSVVENNGAVGAKERTTFLNIIGGLVGLMLAPGPNGKPRSGYADQAAVIDGLASHYPRVPGLSKRNLEAKFAEAKRSLQST